MKLPFGKAALFAGAAALFAPIPSTAQDYRDLDNVQSDVRIFEGEVGNEPVVYRYTIPPMTTLQIDVIPTGDSELDPTVSVTDVETGEVLVEDDDGGDGLASRARVYSEDGQQVEITVSSYSFFSEEQSVGRYELQLRTTITRPQDMRRVTFGSEETGTLDVGQSHLFTIAGEEGHLLEVALMATGDDLDPMLSLYQGVGANGEALTSNDDGGDGLNSLLRIVLPETGTYTIAAEAFGESSGDYTLRIAPEREYVVQAPSQVLGFGERMSGRIGEGYDSASIDPAEITYQLTEEAISAIRAGNGEVTFNMTTPLFDDEDFPSSVDSFLELGFETPLGFSSLMTDDDGGEGLNSRIAIDLSPISQEPGWLERLRLRASALGSGGAFEVELVEGMQPVEEPEWDAEEAVE